MNWWEICQAAFHNTHYRYAENRFIKSACEVVQRGRSLQRRYFGDPKKIDLLQRNSIKFYWYKEWMTKIGKCHITRPSRYTIFKLNFCLFFSSLNHVIKLSIEIAGHLNGFGNMKKNTLSYTVLCGFYWELRSSHYRHTMLRYHFVIKSPIPG